MDEQTVAKETEAVGGPTALKRGEPPRQQIRKAKEVSRRRFSAEEKIRIVMEGIRGDISVSELCRREGIHTTVYYKWLKEFMEAGKRRLRGDHQREADRSEVQALRQENGRLKQLVAEYALDLMALKKACWRNDERPRAVQKPIWHPGCSYGISRGAFFPLASSCAERYRGWRRPSVEDRIGWACP